MVVQDIPTAEASSDGPGLPLFEGRRHLAIVVVDMVESVRMIEQDETGVIDRWKRFTQRVRAEVLPGTGGYMVKSLGDGMMLTFSEPRLAVAAAHAMRRVMDEVNHDPAHPLSDAAEPIVLRTGIHVGDVVADDVDIYGQSANLTARITTLGGPGEIVVTAQVRDQLVDGLDGHLEDLGTCYLKHVREPVRVYRVGHASACSPLPRRTDYDVPMQPAIAVVPFESRVRDAGELAIGELIADGVIAQLGRNPVLRIISRLSSRGFRGRGVDPMRIGQSLGVQYVLWGSYTRRDDKLVLSIEMVDARSREIVWVERLSGEVADLFGEHCPFVDRIAAGTSEALQQAEVRRIRRCPLPTLESYALLLGGINLMHHSTKADFDTSQKLLAHVIDRHPKTVAARAWLAKSYVLGHVTGLGAGLAQDGRLALELTHRALHIDPDNALSQAVQGYVYCHLLGDPDKAMQCLDSAIGIAPNDHMAWLFRSVACAMWGDPAQAVASACQAELISPCDPLAYFIQSVKASSLLTAGRFAEAIDAATQSLRLNCHHTPTLRVLLTAQVQAGQVEQAQATLRRLRTLDPGFSLTGYLASGNAQSRGKQQTAQALRILGMVH